jgi:hypothetical protein
MTQAKVYYADLAELIKEWQDSETQDPIWTYLGISKETFDAWAADCKAGKFEN